MKDKIIQILISSPGDVYKKYFNIIKEAVDKKSRSLAHYANAFDIRFTCNILQWVVSSFACYEEGESAQDELDMQLVQECDCIIALFFSRLGKPTKNYCSGTVEEIKEGYKIGKQVGVIWIKDDIPQELIASRKSIDNWKALIQYMNDNNNGLHKEVSEETLPESIEQQIDRFVAAYLCGEYDGPHDDSKFDNENMINKEIIKERED